MKKEKYESQLRLHQIAAALGLRVKDLFEKATKILMDMMQPTTASSTTSMTTASRYL